MSNPAFGHGFCAFVRAYLLPTGFLDRRKGFMLAVSSAEVTYTRNFKAMLPNSGRKRGID